MAVPLLLEPLLCKASAERLTNQEIVGPKLSVRSQKETTSVPAFGTFAVEIVDESCLPGSWIACQRIRNAADQGEPGPRRIGIWLRRGDRRRLSPKNSLNILLVYSASDRAFASLASTIDLRLTAPVASRWVSLSGNRSLPKDGKPCRIASPQMDSASFCLSPPKSETSSLAVANACPAGERHF